VDGACHDGEVVAVAGHAPDKAPVDLELVHRQSLEVCERGVAGAEVVEGDVDPEVAQSMERLR
jgi:hypothetical protein